MLPHLVWLFPLNFEAHSNLRRLSLPSHINIGSLLISILTALLDSVHYLYLSRMEAISKQLVLSTQSGRLKPDVRLGVAVSEFAQSLDDDRKREFHKMQTAGTQLCGRDAIRVTEELNRKSERSHHTWRPYGTKCGKFLDRLRTHRFSPSTDLRFPCLGMFQNATLRLHSR